MENLRRVKKLFEFMLQNDLELVSYGLAPNPNGFCFENHGKASPEVLKHVSKELNNLNKSEIAWLKQAAL